MIVSSSSAPPATSSSRAVGCCAGALAAIFAAVFGVTATGSYAGVIGPGIGDAALTAWMSNTAQICQAVLGPTVSLSADLWGRKPFMMVGLALGAIGAIVTATSHHAYVALIGAVITGFGFASQGLYVATASETFPRNKRPMMQAIFNISSSLGGVMGLVAGGLYIKHNVLGAGWRMIYATLAIVYGLACLVIFVFYRPAQKRPDVSAVFRHHRYKVMAIDPIGVLLLLSAVVPFYYGLVSALNPYKWSDAHVLGPLCAGLACFAAFGVWEWKGNSQGLLHHALFSRSRNYALSLALLFIEGILFFSFNAFWAREASMILGLPSWEAGLNFLWFFLPSTFATPVVGWASQRYKEVKLSLATGFSLFVVGSIGMATVQPSSRIAMRAYACIAGIGFSSPLTLMSVCAQLAAPPELLALASVNLLVSRALGGVVAVAVYNAVGKTRTAALVGPRLAAAVAPFGFPEARLPALVAAAQVAGGAALKKLPGMTPEIMEAIEMAMRHVYADSYRWIWAIAAPVAVIAVAGVLCLEPIAPMMTRNIDAPADAAPQFVDAEADVGGNVDELKPEVELIETASAQELEKV
ncbi:hypothetical protein C6P46_000683 [Rhodotorula mucilaginosa]|uniref:Major facilitator superfamily (MFS) profile domain-containing protein n=1 Tax=Rhodotorula mucilaginosa TaxID=5537 RepID=A0A9P7B2S4_RHOMI|nr:hypothetical protein C6P46_000683 [Rhodotorula mucilaginosa]